MTADEMFAEMGYVCEVKSRGHILYSKYIGGMRFTVDAWLDGRPGLAFCVQKDGLNIPFCGGEILACAQAIKELEESNG